MAETRHRIRRFCLTYNNTSRECIFEAESFVFIIDDADSTEGVAGTIEAVYGVSWLETVGSIATLLDHV